MSQRGASRAAERSRESRQVAVFLAVRQLSALGDLMLLGDSPALAAEMRERARGLLRLLDARADARRFPGGVIDLHRHFRLRAIAAALGAPEPNSPPPRRA